MVLGTAFLCLVGFVFTSLSLAEAPDPQHDWSQWRGPNRNGIAAAGQTPPVDFSATKNVVWKTEVPGRGHSSPIIVGDRIFLTTADEQRQIQGAICFDRKTGKQLWITPLHNGGFPTEIHKKNTHASGSVACDGEQIYAAFYTGGKIMVSALTLDGKKVWSRSAGTFTPKKYKFGYGASPIVHNNLVIVASEYDGPGSAITAFDTKSGKVAWKTKRRADISFSSPIIASIDGTDQLLISGLFEVSSYSPTTGKKNWSVKGTTQATCGTMVWTNDIVIASGGYPNPQTIAVKADGSKTLWTNREKSYEQSMLAVDGYVYAITDKGVGYCWDATTGEEKWKTRLSGPVSSSPILVGDHIYAANESGDIFVFKANPEKFESVARNRLGDELFATPSFVDGKAFYRIADRSGGNRQEYLYCIGAE